MNAREKEDTTDKKSGKWEHPLMAAWQSWISGEENAVPPMSAPALAWTMCDWH